MNTLLCCVLLFGQTESSEVVLARARINLAGVTVPEVKQQPAKDQEPESPAKRLTRSPEMLGTVQFYTKPGCGPCELQKTEFGIWYDPTGRQWVDSLSPFEFEIIDASKVKVPDYVQGFPTLAWAVPNGVRFVSGFQTQDQFMKVWKANQHPYDPYAISKPKASAPVPKPRASQPNTYNMQWHINSGESLYDHLKNTHGINPAGMSTDQMKMAHDAAHVGQSRSVQVMRRRGRR